MNFITKFIHVTFKSSLLLLLSCLTYLPASQAQNCTCINCDGSTVQVDSNVTVDFNTNPPTYTGDQDLHAYFSFDNSGPTADTWKAIFDAGSKKILIKSGYTITVTNVPATSNNQRAPGILFKSTCDFEMENSSLVLVNPLNRLGGNITLEINGMITINGIIRNQESGTNNYPGAITITSSCGNITVGQTGLVEILGGGGGGNAISLSTCESSCNTGDITINGLVKSFAHNTVNTVATRPTIKVVSFKGKVIVNANTADPLYDEYQNSGSTFDLYGGLLSWTRDNVPPGKVEVQAKDSIIINGHGVDPSAPVRTSFGAIACVATMSDAPGGLVDVRSLESSIVGNNRAFDVSGRNRLSKNYANIVLLAKNNIVLNRPGVDNSYNPVVNATAPGNGDHGGTNTLRAFSGGIVVGSNAWVSANVLTGTTGTTGKNVLTSCLGISNSGLINPPDLVTPDDINSCSPDRPDTIYHDCGLTKIETCDCIDCSGSEVIVDQNVTVNFNTNPPTYTGDPDLFPYYFYDNTGATVDTWKAIFDVGPRKLTLRNGITITVNTVPLNTTNNRYSPGIVIKSLCHVVIEDTGHVVVSSLNKTSGDIVFQVNGNITVNGEIRNQTTGTNDVPGAISVTSLCGNINVGRPGLIQILGVGGGGNTISLATCVSVCNPGDITIDGLIKSYTPNTANLATNRPNIRVVSLNGKVTVNANTAEPLFDEFQESGTRFDVYGGLLSWTRDNVPPGKVEVQAKDSVIVNGHGIDPTAPVRESWGAIAAIATMSNAPAGLVDVRSLQGSIVGNNRAFDVSGRNRITPNYANINLWAKNNVVLNRPGATNDYNPVVDASSPSVGDKGGKSSIRAYSGSIIIGANALVSASVPAGSGTVQGINELTSCGLISNAGTVTPADLNNADDFNACTPSSPDEIYSDCSLGSVVRLANPQAINGQNSLMSVFPNPASDKITVAFYNPEKGTCTIRVVDMAGRTVINKIIEASEGDNQHVIDLQDIEKSVYLIILENHNTISQSMIMVR